MNIFYDDVDPNLQIELNARGQAGLMDRTNKSLNFMLGKIANAQLTAYEGTGSASKPVPIENFGVIGGGSVTSGRYLPSGPDGYLRDRDISRIQTQFYGDPGTLTDYEQELRLSKITGRPDPIGRAYDKPVTFTDTSRRIGPYLTGVDVTIGDHSMGLLNKATVQIVIPNPERDLDLIETTWFRPGRFVRIDIEHPDSALVSYDITAGLLTTGSVPNKEKLKELYPGWDIDALTRQIRRMNVFTFEGLLTSFDFSYTGEGSVEASLSLTGTSNVYADISMYLPNGGTPTTKTAATVNTNFALGPAATTQSIIDPKDPNKKKTIIVNDTSSVVDPSTNKHEFYSKIYRTFEDNIKKYITQQKISKPADQLQVLIPFITDSDPTPVSDRFLLAGELFPTKQYTFTVPIPTASGATPANFNTSSFAATLNSGEIEEIQYFPNGTGGLLNNNFDPVAKITVTSKAEYERYITLGALVQAVNDYALSKYTPGGPDLSPAQIICTDLYQGSNYYPLLTSCTPNEILLLPADPLVKSGFNWHGDLGYYPDIVKAKTTQEQTPTEPWFGIYEVQPNGLTVIRPSRIFINLQTIERIIDALTGNNIRSFTVTQFLTSISSAISYATGNAINMKLVTDRNDQNKLLFVDANYLKSADPKSTKNVLPYSIPMFANHPKGSVVREFKLSATLPENAKNLSYVLNSGDDISTDQIAPYLNFMYSSGDAAAINKAIDIYKARHLAIIENLRQVKEKNGQYPIVKQNIVELYKALVDYIKIPNSDIRKSQQITAPIFPFTADFTIDGINGLRYGDVVQFEALPKRYRINTVFSVISVTHTVSSQGEWTTNVTTIMRPSID